MKIAAKVILSVLVVVMVVGVALAQFAKFEAAAATPAEAARSGDLEAVKAPFGAVAQSCKACHKPFRR